MPEPEAHFFQPGDAVVLRHVETPTTVRMVHAVMGDSVAPSASNAEPFLVNGEIVTVGARPYRVVSDTEAATVLHQPEGTLIRRWHIAEQRYLEGTGHARGETLRFLFPDRAYDVTLFFESGGDVAWYYDALFSGEGLRAGWRERRRASTPEPEAPVSPRQRRFRGWYVNMQSPLIRTPYGFDIVDHTLDIVVRPDRTWYWKDEDELAIAVKKGACSQAVAGAIRRAGEQALEALLARRGPFDEAWTRWQPASQEPVTSFPDGWQTASPLVAD